MDHQRGDDGAISIPVRVYVAPSQQQKPHKPRKVFCDSLSAHTPGVRFRRDLPQTSSQLPPQTHSVIVSTPIHESDDHISEQTVTHDVPVFEPAQVPEQHAFHDDYKKIAGYLQVFFAAASRLISISTQKVGNILLSLRELYRASSHVRLWQMSMTAALFVGMISVAVIYKNFGTDVYASNGRTVIGLDPMTVLILEGGTSAIAGELPIQDIAPEPAPGELPLEEVSEREVTDPEQIAFEARAAEMVQDHPIERMLPEIFELDREVAAYVLSIAKIESNWGKRVPVLNGEDCFNYWGYRAQRERMGSGGHTCFDSPADAVRTVGKRIHSLVYEYERREPRQMLVWKCGSTCAGHSDEGVERWVRVVAAYRNYVREGDDG